MRQKGVMIVKTVDLGGSAARFVVSIARDLVKMLLHRACLFARILSKETILFLFRHINELGEGFHGRFVLVK